jgi:EAL domain-containing protein (putative c-di-GMP-specific phosphodiesterase class I)
MAAASARRRRADVAAGVESLEDLLVLARLGVAYGQGYVIARPGADFPPPAPLACAALAA